jgi:hypothetical protein
MLRQNSPRLTPAGIKTRELVVSYALQLKAEGLPFERVLSLVRDAAREATPVGDTSLVTGDRMERAVRWAVHAYYADSGFREPRARRRRNGSSRAGTG